MFAVRRAQPLSRLRDLTTRGLAMRGFASVSAVSTRLVPKEEISDAQRERIVDVLTDSFLSYPEHTLMWSDNRNLNRTLMSAAVQHTINKHRVWVAEADSQIVGAGLWTDPGAVWFAEEDIPTIFGPVMQLLDPQTIGFMVGDMLPNQAALEETYAPGCAADWSFGAMLGVDPRAQGLGVGGKILSGIIARAGDVPIAFHTQGAKNLYFYGKYGFKVAAEHNFVLPNGETWGDRLMVRRPQPSA